MYADRECMYVCQTYMLMHIVILFIGLNISEVAHDYQVQVTHYVTDELGFLNSYDTWHGEYNNVL